MTTAAYTMGEHKISTKQLITPGGPAEVAWVPTLQEFECCGGAPEGVEDAAGSPAWACHPFLEKAATRMSGAGSAKHVTAVARPTLAVVAICASIAPCPPDLLSDSPSHRPIFFRSSDTSDKLENEGQSHRQRYAATTITYERNHKQHEAGFLSVLRQKILVQDALGFSN
jgi:hypothetical protein